MDKDDRRSRLTTAVSSLYPEELLAIPLFVATVAINIAANRTLDFQILIRNVETYRSLFRGQITYFVTGLLYCILGYVLWQGSALALNRPTHLRVWAHPSRMRPAVRALPVYVLCSLAFGNLQGFIHRISPVDRDALLIAIDQALFLGYQPLKILEPLVSPRGAHLFTQVYISFAVLPFAIMLVFLHHGNTGAFRDTIVAIVLALFVGYWGYLLLPAIGPQYTLRHMFSRPIFDVDAMLANGGIERLPRDTFPSIHTAVSVIGLILMWRHGNTRLHRYGFALWSSAIVFSTVYLRIHYVFDVIAGIVLALLVTQLAPGLNRWHASRRRTGEYGRAGVEHARVRDILPGAPS